MSFYHQLFAYILGVFLAGAFAYAANRMRSDERWLFTWIMGVVIIGFVGFPTFIADWSSALTEAVIIAVLGGLLAISWVRRSALLLGIVYLGHCASDVFHLAFDLSPSNPAWLHEFCIPFDGLLGIYILVQGSRWSNSESS